MQAGRSQPQLAATRFWRRQLAAPRAAALLRAMLLRRRPCAGRRRLPPCRCAVTTASSYSTVAWRRALSSSASGGESDNSVGVVHPRRTATERLEHVEAALARLPVFPLGGTIVFPGALCPLYIFEPRYRVLVQRLLKDGSHRCFGICGSGLDQETVVGTVVEITHNHWNEDGSASVVTKGLCRFSAPTSALTTGAFGYHELPDGAAEVSARFWIAIWHDGPS